jgi:hypothetical protein
MLHHIARTLTLIVVCIALSACQTIVMPFPPQLLGDGAERTPVELQAIQTREYDSNKSQLISVFITVFQDAGYIIDQADLSTGLITARAPVEKRLLTVGDVVTPDQRALIMAWSSLNLTNPSGHTLETLQTFNVLVTEITPKRSKARLSINLQMKISPGSFAPHENLDSNPDRYQAIFSRVQQGLFLKNNLE